ncbi:MAG: zinc-ribbon domain-containing protein [Paracoccaceae bacterium]
MRLICPNCNAQYEVDEAAIPAAGRDVQCSSCGHTWFQDSAATLREREAAEAAAAPPPSPPPEPAPEPEPAGLTRRKPDESVLNVLREEAAREAEARRAEGTSLEMQEDFGPMAPPEPPPPAQPATEEEGPDPALVPRASRRELLPDIEEINSTLRPTSERGGDAASYDAPETRRRERSGFRRGFLTSVFIMVLALLPYTHAGTIARAVPALEGTLASYSAGVDSIRLWLDDLMHRATAGMKPQG